MNSLQINRRRDEPCGKSLFTERSPRKKKGEHTCIGKDREKKKKRTLRCAMGGPSIQPGLAYTYGPDAPRTIRMKNNKRTAVDCFSCIKLPSRKSLLVYEACACLANRKLQRIIGKKVLPMIIFSTLKIRIFSLFL